MTVVVAGVFLALLASFTIAAVAWRAGRRDGLATNDLLEVHNDRLRVKNRQLHEDNARLHRERAELNDFLSVVTPEEWSA